nr:YlmH/Sll1252 family protein [Clostridium bornimense]
MELIKIKFSIKFQSVTHRDILGALMSLGIKREKLGDLIIEESYGLVVVHEDIKDYIISNLVKIKNSSCDIETLSLEECKNFEKKFQEKIEIVSSLRFDSIVSSICNKSRNYAVDLINSGSCKINYLDIRDKSKEVKINDVITVRGYGKFKLDEVISSTRSGRIKVKIKKYV